MGRWIFPAPTQDLGSLDPYAGRTRDAKDIMTAAHAPRSYQSLVAQVEIHPPRLARGVAVSEIVQPPCHGANLAQFTRRSYRLAAFTTASTSRPKPSNLRMPLFRICASCR